MTEQVHTYKCNESLALKIGSKPSNARQIKTPRQET